MQSLEIDKGSRQQRKQLFSSAIVDQKVDMATDFNYISLTVKFRH